MAREITNEIFRNLRVNDRASHFELVGRDMNQEVMKVTAPIEDGVAILRVMLFGHHSVPDEEDDGPGKWKTFIYPSSEVTGVAALLDGFTAASGVYPLSTAPATA